MCKRAAPVLCVLAILLVLAGAAMLIVGRDASASATAQEVVGLSSLGPRPTAAAVAPPPSAVDDYRVRVRLWPTGRALSSFDLTFRARKTGIYLVREQKSARSAATSCAGLDTASRSGQRPVLRVRQRGRVVFRLRPPSARRPWCSGRHSGELVYRGTEDRAIATFVFWVMPQGTQRVGLRTASKLAENLEDAEPGDHLTDVKRCFVVEPNRVDCIVTFSYGGPDQAYVAALIVHPSGRPYHGEYGSWRARPPYTRERYIKREPKWLRLTPFYGDPGRPGPFLPVPSWAFDGVDVAFA